MAALTLGDLRSLADLAGDSRLKAKLVGDRPRERRFEVKINVHPYRVEALKSHMLRLGFVQEMFTPTALCWIRLEAENEGDLTVRVVACGLP